MLGKILRKSKVNDKDDVKKEKTKIFYNYYRLKDSVQCPLIKLVIVESFLKEIINEDFIEDGEYASFTYFSLERDHSVQF